MRAVKAKHAPRARRAKPGHKNAADEEIIAATRAAVDYAAQMTAAMVEAEPRYLGGSSNLHDGGSTTGAPEHVFIAAGARASARRASTRSRRPVAGTSTAAIRCPSASLDLLGRIRGAIDVNISLHGGNGTPGRDIEGAVHMGGCSSPTATPGIDSTRWRQTRGTRLLDAQMSRPTNQLPTRSAWTPLRGFVGRSVSRRARWRVRAGGGAGTAVT